MSASSSAGTLEPARQTPSGHEHRDTNREQPRVRTEWTRSEQIDEQNPHAEELAGATDIIKCCARSQIVDSLYPLEILLDLAS
jgi:hypothetical protein